MHVGGGGQVKNWCTNPAVKTRHKVRTNQKVAGHELFRTGVLDSCFKWQKKINLPNPFCQCQIVFGGGSVMGKQDMSSLEAIPMQRDFVSLMRLKISGHSSAILSNSQVYSMLDIL
ncbi:hypothetical protein AMECASPLE_026322 [Ameca splendens]|uniref:Uncharacterized protein n=1 Tax=Ameca splendens TaxID=208324 RepID=A0ABV0ZR40_9TELE